MHLTPKYFSRLNKSLYLFETHCAVLFLFNPNLDFFQAVKVTKSGHRLLHDRASKGYGSIPGIRSSFFAGMFTKTYYDANPSVMSDQE